MLASFESSGENKTGRPTTCDDGEDNQLSGVLSIFLSSFHPPFRCTGASLVSAARPQSPLNPHLDGVKTSTCFKDAVSLSATTLVRHQHHSSVLSTPKTLPQQGSDSPEGDPSFSRSRATHFPFLYSCTPSFSLFPSSPLPFCCSAFSILHTSPRSGSSSYFGFFFFLSPFLPFP